MAAPFEAAFATQKQLESSANASKIEGGSAPIPSGSQGIMEIHYRDDEAIYVIPAEDRVTVVFSTTFKEETDRIIGKVFLQVSLADQRSMGRERDSVWGIDLSSSPFLLDLQKISRWTKFYSMEKSEIRKLTFCFFSSLSSFLSCLVFYPLLILHLEKWTSNLELFFHFQ